MRYVRPMHWSFVKSVAAVLASSTLGTVAFFYGEVSFASELTPSSRPAEITPLAKRAVMEAIVSVGDRLIAVGERGIVLRSDDFGRSWQQAQTPVSVTLTAVQFTDTTHGWAVGHGGIVLSTQDGGVHWRKVLDGASAARLSLAEAQTLSTQSAMANARRMVAEGSDKPFLSLSFSDNSHGTVVGAYGLVMRTEDGGKTWQSWSGRVGNTRALHLYAVKQQGSQIWIAGEQGLVVRSLDAGTTFSVIQTPYKGSFFSLDISPTGTVLLAGLRGNAFRTTDGGVSFKPVELNGPVTITDVHYTKGGDWLVADASGQVFNSADDAISFKSLIGRPTVSLNGVAQDSHGNIVGATFAGPLNVAEVGDLAAQSQKAIDGKASGGKQ